MSRETENALLLLVGVSTAIVTLSGAYTRYVKPALQPWLLASAALLIVLALAAIVSGGEPVDAGPVVALEQSVERV